MLERSIVVPRDFRWNGQHFRGLETFFLGQVATDEVPGAQGLTGEEDGALLGYGWFTSEELATSAEPLQPPELPAILERLDNHH